MQRLQEGVNPRTDHGEQAQGPGAFAHGGEKIFHAPAAAGHARDPEFAAGGIPADHDSIFQIQVGAATASIGYVANCPDGVSSMREESDERLQVFVEGDGHGTKRTEASVARSLMVSDFGEIPVLGFGEKVLFRQRRMYLRLVYAG
jgi:hypothetical protein